MSLHPIPVLLYEIIQDLRARDPNGAPLVGVAGAQGSGKSYQCRLLAMSNQPRFAHFSLDDVYFTHAEREETARLDAENHNKYFPELLPDPEVLKEALATRGPPGTHDLALARGLIARLRQGLPTPLPRFDKTTDDRAPESEWPIFSGAPEAILIDGWCLGANAPSAPLDENETRGFLQYRTNYALEHEYAAFFASFDAIVYLRAPSWEIVRRWRGEQEEQLRGRPLTDAENAWLDRFLTYYEEVTRSMMAGHHSAKWIVHLDEARKVQRIEVR